MRAGDRDTLILVWGSAEDTQTACEEIVIRAEEATVGIPSDTRQPMKDGTNGFERVLPGADRMYPDTDLPPIAINDDRVARARQLVPEFVWETEARYAAGGMVDHDVQTLCISPRSGSITRAIEEYKTSAMMLGVFVAQRFRAMAREDLRPERLSDDTVYSQTQRLLQQARGLQQPGPVLRQQMARVAGVLRMAITPIAVLLESDEETEVTVYKVAKLGTFRRQQLELKPGTYTAVGVRNGYRDVRRKFTLSHDQTAQVIEIACTDPI